MLCTENKMIFDSIMLETMNVTQRMNGLNWT